MTRRYRTLPLGVDIGQARVRVALTSLRSGEPHLEAVAAYDHDGDVARALGAALEELHTDERRCVIGIGMPEARLCFLDLPPMPVWERMRAARIEATHLSEYPIGEAALSLVRLPAAQRWCLGIARKPTIAAALKTVRRMGLRPVAVDDAMLALHRAQPAPSCLIDIGLQIARIAIFGEPIPMSAAIPIGGEHLTAAIGLSLGIDRSAAERRKRQTGFAGAGEPERDALIAAIAGILAERPFPPAERCSVVLCGNGSRVPGFCAELSAALDADVSLANLAADRSTVLPADVLRAAGTDWSQAYGLSLWSHSA